MNKLNSKIAVLEVALLLNTSVFAQERPPTAGSPPIGGGDSNFPAVLYPAIGAAVVGATYFLVKKRPSVVPTPQHLEVYLLNNGILPTPDALNLMYELNPALRNTPEIPSNYKLNKPDFPDLPKNAANAKAAAVGGTVSSALRGHVIKMRSSLDNFRKAKIAVKSSSMDHSTLSNYLADVEKQLTAYEQQDEDKNTIREKFLGDLLKVLNQTLDKTTSSGIVNEREFVLIKDISENINELLSPLDEIDREAEQQGRLHFKHPGEYAQVLLSKINISSNYSRKVTLHPFQFISSTSKKSKPDRTYQLQPFAFAVYKMDTNGRAITKGPDVEKKYQILYVCPALKDYPEAYTTIETSATFAFESLPAARYHLAVKDANDNSVALKNAVIDTRKAFSSQQRKYVNKHIIIPILVR